MDWQFINQDPAEGVPEQCPLAPWSVTRIGGDRLSIGCRGKRHNSAATQEPSYTRTPHQQTEQRR